MLLVKPHSLVFVIAAWTEIRTFISFKSTYYINTCRLKSSRSSDKLVAVTTSGLRFWSWNFISLLWKMIDSRSERKICWSNLRHLGWKAREYQQLQRLWPRDRGTHQSSSHWWIWGTAGASIRMTGKTWNRYYTIIKLWASNDTKKKKKQHTFIGHLL